MDTTINIQRRHIERHVHNQRVAVEAAKFLPTDFVRDTNRNTLSVEEVKAYFSREYPKGFVYDMESFIMGHPYLYKYDDGWQYPVYNERYIQRWDDFGVHEFGGMSVAWQDIFYITQNKYIV
jgi:hypothetical protein